MPERTSAEQVWGVVRAHAAALGVPVSLCSLCQAAVARLPVAGVAVSVRGGLGAAEILCATGSLSRKLEELQITVGEGPTVGVLAGGPSALVDDLDRAQEQARWPLFAAEAVQAGARALVALPLRVGAIRVGAFVLSSERPGPLSGEDLAQTWVFAELAVRLVLDERTGIDSQNGYPVLDGSSGYRPEIHQAIGMVSVQLGIGVTEASSMLRARAFAGGRTLSELATEVVARRLRFDPEDTT